MIGFIRTRKLIVLLAVTPAPACVSAQELRPRSILVLDQSDLRGPFYYQVFSGLRAVVAADTREHTTLYAENLDLSRFEGPAYEESLQRYLKERYRDRQIGVIVAVGAAALELVLHWRAELWPGIPIVFAMVDEMDYARLKLPSDVTGGIVKLGLADTIAVARAVVPRLKTIVFVGDAWDRQVIFRNLDDEIPTVANGLNVVEIIGLTMAEIRKKVAELPDDSAIIYSATNSDGEGTFYPPATALALIAETANRPIIVDAETFLAPGGIGGFVLVPDLIGADAARLALRILDGESPSNIPPATGGVKPLFNWGQMQRWQVSKSSLPAGSEIRFREPGLWEKYRWQSYAFCVVLLQAGLIVVPLYERKRRHHAEFESRHRMSELAHVNRSATAGELSSSIAHELSQPLGAILTNTETAELILSGPSPDLGEVREILADIRRDELRANDASWSTRSTGSARRGSCTRSTTACCCPGPEAQQLAIYIGWLLHRTAGGIVAGGAVRPARLRRDHGAQLVYAACGNVGLVEALFFGLKAAVLAIVLEAVVRVGRRALRNRVMVGIAAAAFVAHLLLRRAVSR